MFAGSRRLRPVEPLEPAADAFADALIHAGDPTAAADALALAAPYAEGATLALRRGERALARGDAAEALAAMIPAWERGHDEPALTARLALASLALGLYDIAGALTDDAPAIDHRLVRWILDLWEGDRPQPLALDRAEVAWALRAMLRQLARCGRDDLAARAYAAAVTACPAAAARLGEPPAPPPETAPFSPPLGGRAAFCAAWRGPAPDAVFSWAWSAGRQVLRGERALLLCPQPGPLRPLFAHGRLLALAPRAADGAHAIADPEALPVAGARWHHAAAVLWLEQALAPLDALRGIARALTHEGQLHLLCAGPRAEAAPETCPLRLAPALIERACARAGLEVLGVAARDADGRPVAPADAAVLLLHAERRVV